MVGLVLVSHSHAMVSALKNMIAQMMSVEIPVAVAGGLAEDRNVLGTDPMDICEAITSVESPKGVVVLVDLGSAVMSAEMALEFLPEETRRHVRVCCAPLVEGAVSAAVRIGAGADLEKACLEAEKAMLPKMEHLGEGRAQTLEPGSNGKTASLFEKARSITLTINTPHGLHARPAVRFVETAALFDAAIGVKKLDSDKEPAPADSLNSLTTLDIGCGDQVVVCAEGPDAKEALEALAHLVNEEFNPQSPEHEAVPQPRDLQGGVALSEGVAMGALYLFQKTPPKISNHRTENPDREWRNLLRAKDQVRNHILERRNRVSETLNKINAAIFDGHVLMLERPSAVECCSQKGFPARTKRRMGLAAKCGGNSKPVS